MIVGASYDTPADNKAFADSQAFPFRLLADQDRSVAETYDVTKGPDEPYPDFPMRISYLIDPDGVIRRSYEVKDVDGHADEVLADLAALQGG